MRTKALLRGGAGPELAAYSPIATPAIGQVIARAVRPHRKERYQTPATMADDLRRALAGEGLAAEAIHLAAPHRLTPVAPRIFDWVRGFGALGMTLILMFWSTLATAALYLIFGLFPPSQGVEPVIAETITPVPWPEPTASSLTPTPVAPSLSVPAQTSAPFSLPDTPGATVPSPPTNTPSDLVPLSTGTRVPAERPVSGP